MKTECVHLPFFHGSITSKAKAENHDQSEPRETPWGAGNVGTGA